MVTLITGASGFLGSYIKNSFLSKKLDFITLGRSNSNNIVCDLGNEIPKITSSIHTVIHAAGKAHIVPKTEKEKAEFYKSIVIGTKNLLSSLENSADLKRVIFISSVSVYGLIEGENITEEQPLNAKDIYGQCKIEAERLILQWCDNKGISYYILRIPLIFGNNAPGNLGAMFNGIQKGKYARIGNGTAKKSVISAENLSDFLTNINGLSGTYNLNDGYHPSFSEIENFIMKSTHKNKIIVIPYFVAFIIAIIGNIFILLPLNLNKLKKITSTLTFSNKKAIDNINFKPIRVITN